MIARSALKGKTGTDVAAALGYDPADVAGVGVEEEQVRVVTSDGQVHLHEIVEG